MNKFIKNKTIKKIFLKLSMIGLIVINLFSYYTIKPVKVMASGNKKAIIVVPGILGSGLFWNSKKTWLYYKNEAVWIVLNKEYKLESLKSIDKLVYNYKDMCINGDGNSNNMKIGKYESGSFDRKVDADVLKYGTSNSYYNVIDLLERKYGKNSDVIFFNYDFRKDNNLHVKSLSNLIDKYEEVILISHSMGGIISELTFADRVRNDLDNTKIKAFFPVGVPHRGSVQTVERFVTGEIFNNYIDVFQKYLRTITVTKSLLRSFISVYQLLPQDVSGMISDENKKPMTQDELFDMLISDLGEDQRAQKNAIKGFNDFCDKFEIDGNHILNVVNFPSYAIVGIGQDTVSHARFSKNSFSVLSYSKYGDGTVLETSSIPSFIKFHRICKTNAKHSLLLDDPTTLNYIETNINKIFKN